MADLPGSRKGAGVSTGQDPEGTDQGEPAAGVEAMAKRNSGWSQAEHLLYLLGLESHGRGAWRAIASHFCISRTPTQVASHAQKYFRRQELTASQRHKKRPSIHDITCGSIYPSATGANREAVRVVLQNIVREGRDITNAGDSSAGNSGTSSSSKSALSHCLPIQDPAFALVFAFADGAGWGAAGGSTPDAVPRPLQYPAMQLTHLPAPYTHGNNWAIVPVGGTMVHPGLHEGASGMILQPVAYSTADHSLSQQPQDQQAYILPGYHSAMNTWPQQHAVSAAVPQTHPPYLGLPPSASAAQDPEQPAHTSPGASLASAPAAAAMLSASTSQPQPVAESGHAAGLVVRAGGGELDAPPPRGPPPQPPPRPLSTTPEPGQAAGVVGNDRGLKRNSFSRSEQERSAGAFRLHSMPHKMPKSSKFPWHPPMPAMPVPPPHSHLRPPPLPPQQPRLQLLHPQGPPGTATALRSSSTTTPKGAAWPAPPCVTSACMPSHPIVRTNALPAEDAGVDAASGAPSGGRQGDAVSAFPSQHAVASRPSSISGSFGTSFGIGSSSVDSGVAPAVTFAADWPVDLDSQDGRGLGIRPGTPSSGHLGAPCPPYLSSQHQSDCTRGQQVSGDIHRPECAVAPTTVALSSLLSHSQTPPPRAPQGIHGACMHSMHDAPPPHPAMHPMFELQAPSGPPLATGAPRLLMHSRVNSWPQQAFRPWSLSVGATDMLRRPISVAQMYAAADPSVSDRPLEQARGADSMEDLMGQLLGSSADVVDSACIGTFSWDLSHSRSGSGDGKSGSAGRSRSGGSDAVNSPRRGGFPRRRSAP